MSLNSQSNFSIVFQTFEIGQRKRIALVAHDNKKSELLECLLTSPFISSTYTRIVPSFEHYLKREIKNIENYFHFVK
jgi:hypothetical protein